MPSHDREKSFESMVTLDQKQLQQNRQDKDKDYEGHLNKISSNQLQRNFRNLETANGIRKIGIQEERDDNDWKEEEEANKNEDNESKKEANGLKNDANGLKKEANGLKEETEPNGLKKETEANGLKAEKEANDWREKREIERYLNDIQDETEEEEEDEQNVANRNTESYCVEIEDYYESTQSSDVEEDLEEDVLRDRGWISEIPSAPQNNCEIGTVNGLALPTVEAPCFGDVCVKNSNNVHLGSKTFYKGPVTIKQFVYSNSEVKKDEELGGDEKRDSVPSQNISHSSDVPLNQEIIKVKQWLITWRWAAIFCTISLMFVTIIVVIVLTSSGRNKRPTDPIFPENPDSSTGGDSWTHDVVIVGRNDWLAQPPDSPLEKINLPVKYVFISHTATDFCIKQSECTKRVRTIQLFHVESNGWSDIAYNFLVGGDGRAYEGRGWDYIGAHTFNYNNNSMGISFIGIFNEFVPNKGQIHAAKRLIEEGVKLGKISQDYILLGHRQVSKTLSPGDALFTLMKRWPHWSATP